MVILDIPDNVKNNLEEGVCITCCDSVVLCMSEDYPMANDTYAATEVDRSDQNLLIRHIIYDDPSNPLTVEYIADRKFISRVINQGYVKVIFLDKLLNEEVSTKVKLGKEEIAIIKKEASV
ncbi:hypothetical protein [Sulfuracidifex metallicus]|uniref:hypothetical protein n=1 Tax=Sulfuracidifex metallicus TaxID=47303 RepID=UPI002276232C|nr:hypothetical protein [Sulfuracidifex metallicus]MCY0850731.1 hypothetical protein [Sulfuracidifex metallicus]